MNPDLRSCQDCGLKSVSLTNYQNRAGTNLDLCSSCLSRRDISKYRPAFVEESIKSKIAQSV